MWTYVDDTGTVVNSNTQAHEMPAYLNSKHPTIQFETELPDNKGFLPILDIKIQINENGEMEHKLFAKAANKGITTFQLAPSPGNKAHHH